MLDAKAVLNVNGKMFYFFGITVALLFLALFPMEIQAQKSLRRAVYGGESTVPVRPVTKPKTVVIRKTVTPKKTVQSTAKKNASANAKKNLLNITFVTTEPKAEIWIDDKKFGVTDEKRELTKKLAAGEYRILAKTNRQVLFSTQKVTISPEQTKVELIDPAFNKPKPAPVAVAKPKVEEKSELEIAAEISASVKEILEDFGDPKKVDSITQEDWELVFRAAQLGQLQGYTAAQIEAHRWFASGQLELAKNEIGNAFTSFNKSLEFVQNSPAPYYGLGNTYLVKRQYQDAIKLYQRALSFNPKFAIAYRKMGDAYKALNKEKDAISAYKNAILYGYETPETHYLLGMTYLQDKQLEEGISELETVVKEMPKAETFIVIGEAYEKLKRGVSAIENYHKAIFNDPASAVAYYKLGSAYYEQREYGKAKEAFEKAIELDSNGKVLNLAESHKKLREAASKINR
ncbi:MAG: tetratricopeptide repeat protein [Pyrinomonadaceae bacterium]|nr:tetratricopeptide repeat protein [Pyrinomonadaceae bacterium]